MATKEHRNYPELISRCRTADYRAMPSDATVSEIEIRRPNDSELAVIQKKEEVAALA